jgi:hypothetical protein
MAEFDNPTDLVDAANRARVAGYTAMDAYTPFPIEELTEALGIKKNPLPLIVLLGGIFGGLGGYMLEYWTQVIAWPMNIGGPPVPQLAAFHSGDLRVHRPRRVAGGVCRDARAQWPAEAVSPVFNVPAFDRASRDRFFLCIEAADPKFDRHATESFLKDLHALGVSEVAA